MSTSETLTLSIPDKVRWPNAQANLHGSFVTGLGLPWSDLDLVIWLPKVCVFDM